MKTKMVVLDNYPHKCSGFNCRNFVKLKGQLCKDCLFELGAEE